MIRQFLTQVVKKTPSLASVYYIADAWRTRRRNRRGWIAARSGSRHSSLTLEQSLEYIERVWRNYLQYAECETLTGRIVEIGPGDNFGVALHFLRNGATEVIAIDKFQSNRDPAQQDAIYAAMAQRHGMQALFDGQPSEASIRHLTYLPGMPAEHYFQPSMPVHDAVISRAVLEHLDDPLAALAAMWTGLRPGGRLIHRVDLRDHGMFAYSHPLKFQTISLWLYRAMTAGTGRPNRVLISDYRRYVQAHGWSARLGITRLVGSTGEYTALSWDELPFEDRQAALQRVKEIRPHLASCFRAQRDEDLAVAGFVLVVERKRDVC